MRFGNHAVFGCWILFLNEGRGRKAKKTGEPVLREVWKSQGAGGKEGLPEVKLQGLALPAPRTRAVLFSAISPDAWHRAWHMQGALDYLGYEWLFPRFSTLPRHHQFKKK